MRPAIDLTLDNATGAAAWARDLDERARRTLDDPVETAFFAQLVDQAVRTLDARRVLDVGCGTGIPTLAAARAGAGEVVGIDLMECNVHSTRARIRDAGFSDRVRALHASWDDVRQGRAGLGSFDLLVSNPPYVPAGSGVVVDGGVRGTRILTSIVQGAPSDLGGIALVFGSISDPLAVLDAVEAQGFGVTGMQVQSVPFGRYTSRPDTLAHLHVLRHMGYATFCEAHPVAGGAPHAYLTLGLIASRLAPRADFRARLARLLTDYATHGSESLPREPFQLP